MSSRYNKENPYGSGNRQIFRSCTNAYEAGQSSADVRKEAERDRRDGSSLLFRAEMADYCIIRRKQIGNKM